MLPRRVDSLALMSFHENPNSLDPRNQNPLDANEDNTFTIHPPSTCLIGPSSPSKLERTRIRYADATGSVPKPCFDGGEKEKRKREVITVIVLSPPPPSCSSFPSWRSQTLQRGVERDRWSRRASESTRLFAAICLPFDPTSELDLCFSRASPPRSAYLGPVPQRSRVRSPAWLPSSRLPSDLRTPLKW